MCLRFRQLLLTLSFVLLTLFANAGIVLPSLISDNMVMQQNVPVHLWGKADAGENIKISILKQQVMVVADEKGNWETWLSPMKSSVNVTMTLTGTNKIEVKNILIGEVWLASGQSNMEWDVSQSDNAEQEMKDADYPNIRLFVAKKSFSDTIQTQIEGQWVLCTPLTIPKFTAVGYFFGRGLYKKLKVPVGLIEAAWGATNCQAWTPITTINSDPRLTYLNDDWQKIAAGFAQRQKGYETALAQWKITSEEQKAKGLQPSPAPRPVQMITKDKPSVIYNAVIAPLSPYTIRGVIWYQGEANAYERVSYPYRFLFPAMIQSWRDAWKQGDFPFLFVQLSTLFKHPYWPVLRESQTETLKLKNTGMAVTIDVGDSTNAHYKNKQIVGYRLELVARNMVYGENIEFSGPLFRQATIENDKIRIWFEHARGLKSNNGQPLTGFLISGTDGKFLPATAIIDGETILLSNPSITKPVNVHYAFKDAPVVNLENGAGLPAVPFRTDIKNGL